MSKRQHDDQKEAAEGFGGEDSRLSGRVRRYARVGTSVGGLAAQVVGARFLGLGLDRGKHSSELKAALGGLKGPLMKAAQILATTDAIAERVRKTGNVTLRSIGDIARRQTIKDNDADFVPAADMLAELRKDNLKLVELLREAKDIVDEAKDNATSGILDDWTDQAEERAWFLFEASRQEGGNEA